MSEPDAIEVMEGESGPVLFDPDEPWISLREALEAGALGFTTSRTFSSAS